MKIAVVAHIRHAIAEPFAGGMEAHCHQLVRGLRRAGHDVVLFAAAKSDEAGLFAICDAPYDEVLPWNIHRGTSELARYQSAAFDRAFCAIAGGGFDVVHNNSLYAPLIGWLAEAGIPCVTSQHVPPFEAMAQAVARNAAHPSSVHTVTSGDQRDIWRARGVERMRVVYNGVDTDLWTPETERGAHLTWVGRIVPNKGLSQAIDAARLAGAALRIFGPAEDAAYFMREIEPKLGGGIEYHGHRSAAVLRRAIASARGALVTPMWDEPFGLVAAEALACGTPVAAFDRGAIGEVVGDCGALAQGGDVPGLAEAIGRLHTIPHARCRQHALAKLSTEAMISAYEECYEVAIAGARTSSPSRDSSIASTVAELA